MFVTGAVLGVITFFVAPYVSVFPTSVVDLTGAETVTVVLTDKGFVPQRVKVSAGTTVVFTTNTGKQFWPASDSHPEHTILSSFDAKRPVSSYDSWSFTFTQAGTWRYHDHLSLARGVIVVENDVVDCATRENRKQCWNDTVLSAGEQGGVRGALRAVATLRAREPAFGTYCHPAMHMVGEFIYHDYRTNGILTRPEALLYCNSGAMHGLTNIWLNQTGRIEEVTTFCEQLGNQFTDATLKHLYNQCYHGIGDSLFDFSSGRGASSLDTVTSVVAQCDALPVRDVAKRGCVAGAYAALALSLDTQDTRLTSDPYYFCKQARNQSYWRQCYWNMNIVVSRVSNRHLKTALTYLETLADDNELKDLVIRSVASHAAKTYDTQERATIHQACQSLERVAWRQQCVMAYAAGIVSNHVEGQDYRDAAYFCLDPTESASMQQTCISHVVRALPSSAERESFCRYLYSQYPDVECQP